MILPLGNRAEHQQHEFIWKVVLPEPGFPVATPVSQFVSLLHGRLDHLDERPGLVVGCGSGNEVLYLRRAFSSRHVVGIDIEPNFSPLAKSEAGLIVADAKDLPFPGESFDYVAMFHSLEHVGNPDIALAQVKRVVRRGGWVYVGVPNKARLLGYVGAFDATWKQKIAWNLKDYSMRLTGRFENDLGAHAGFEGKELVRLLDAHFRSTQLLTQEYFRLKYGSRLPSLVLDLLLAPQIVTFSVPAHYALCQK